MIARVVENWLTSVNERQYQIPFCQLLLSEGETVIYISSHGQMEQGKDVVTIGPRRELRAYQLKGGKLTLKDWRLFKGEIDELVVYPFKYPSVKSSKLHVPFLVTNGRVADTVINAIGSANAAWNRVKCGPLKLIAGDELVARFVKVHGTFLPRDTKDFRRLLDLIVSGGPSQLEKRKFALLLESVLPINPSSRPKSLEIQRSISSAALLTTYVLQGCERASNHWAVFEGWVMTSSYIAAVVERHRPKEEMWKESLKLCILGATRALEGLAAKAQKDKRQYTQGDPLLKYLPNVQIWGESAVPYLVTAAMSLEKHGAHAVVERVILNTIRSIAQINGQKGRGIPSPYYEPEAAIRLLYGLDQFNGELFAGHSYTNEALVEFLARRLVRRQLAVQWDLITRIHFAKFVPENAWEKFV